MGDAGSGTPRLAGISAAYLAKQLADFADGSRPSEIMTPIAAALTAEDRQAVAVYYRSLVPQERSWSSGATDLAAAAAGAVIWARGDGALAVQACVACHGGAGAAGHGDVYPELSGQPRTYLEAELNAFRSGTRTNDAAAQMRTIAARLRDEDIAALAAYLAARRP